MELEEKEDEWLKAEVEARKRSDPGSGTRLGEAESDLDYLLRKGQHFFVHGDFASAVEVYSHGIKMHRKHGTTYDVRVFGER